MDNYNAIKVLANIEIILILIGIFNFVFMISYIFTNCKDGDRGILINILNRLPKPEQPKKKKCTKCKQIIKE